jgi:O-acetyl-ADP-ribose deacetylase (regulator of RNase III)
MIKIINGNILDATENILCQQVNTCGVMGAGLAKQIINKYPSVYWEYKQICDTPKYLLGEVLYITIKPNKFIACLFGQNGYGRSSKVYTNYQALESALLKVKSFAKKQKYSIAIPYGIGCGLANGDWNIVYDIINRIFDNYNVTIYKLK